MQEIRIPDYNHSILNSIMWFDKIRNGSSFNYYIKNEKDYSNLRIIFFILTKIYIE